MAKDSISTRAVRGGQKPDPSTGAILTPIYQTATYVQEEVGVHKGHTYSRASNPTVSALEANLGALEEAPPAVCFATGLAAEHALFIGLLKAGDHVVCGRVVYGGTYRMLTQLLAGLGIQSSFVDAADAKAVGAGVKANTRLVFLETPGNPTLELTDIAACVAEVRAAERKLSLTRLTIAVDNTFLTPVGQRPLELGADVSLYSTTKHIEGHNATVGGAIVSRDEVLLDRLRWVRKSVGSICGPQDAWLTLRGIKTLPVRLRQHSLNAQTVAEWLEAQELVERVFYPGLASFRQRSLAQRQHLLHGGILAFELKGGAGLAAERGRTLLNSLELISLAESLGAVESLVTHPVTMTHGDVPRAEREAQGITDGLIRLSVGLEDPADVIADLAAALDRVKAEHGEPATTGKAAAGAR
ncbi:MAG: PLP-dependent transferase [Planctomycetota bacterium]